MATISLDRVGFGQVEPNHLSGIVTGQIYAQLPVDPAMGDVIENGRFAKYAYSDGKVKVGESISGEWMLIYNEQKLYDERKQGLKDFAMEKANYTDGEMVPRLIKTNVGDIFTTNTFKKGETINDASLGSFYVGADGYLTATKPGTYAGPVFQAVKVYTMPDGQVGVKLQRVQ